MPRRDRVDRAEHEGDEHRRCDARQRPAGRCLQLLVQARDGHVHRVSPRPRCRDRRSAGANRRPAHRQRRDAARLGARPCTGAQSTSPGPRRPRRRTYHGRAARHGRAGCLPRGPVTFALDPRCTTVTTRPTSFDPSAALAAMTPDEKVALLSGRDFWSLNGVERLGVPSIVVTDGPYGLRKAKTTSSTNIADNVPATCFPTSSALAATWNPGLVEEVASAIGREAAAEGVSVVLGPGANIKRTPLCGRNFEYFSEDPLLSARLAAAWVRGIQAVGVGRLAQALRGEQPRDPPDDGRRARRRAGAARDLPRQLRGGGHRGASRGRSWPPTTGSTARTAPSTASC